MFSTSHDCLLMRMTIELFWQLKRINILQAPLQLRELKVQHSRLYNIPESIGKLKYLERIQLQNIFYGSNLTKLPEEFCLLQSLQTLVLNRCTEMKSLPDSFGNLTNLQHIDLSRFSELDNLLDSFGNLTNLGQLVPLGLLVLMGPHVIVTRVWGTSIKDY